MMQSIDYSSHGSEPLKSLLNIEISIQMKEVQLVNSLQLLVYSGSDSAF